MIKGIAADLHTHTNVSQHAYSTAYENIVAASRLGLYAVGISDHGPAMEDGAGEGHFRNLRVLPRMVEGVRVLRGAEANILDFNGNVDLSDNTRRERLDYCIASFHEDVCRPGTTAEHTAAYLALAEMPGIQIIGHSGTACFAYDYEMVIRRFRETGKIVEINEASFHVRPGSIENCRKIAMLCKKYEVRIVVDTDSHFCSLIGRAPMSLELLNSMDFPEKLVINANVENMARWMEEDLKWNPGSSIK
ncbi:MAG: phosphatase [Lachnospiraceae bacterium]|nr:phosphatase [Lachnospiraceae bacterium]